MPYVVVRYLMDDDDSERIDGTHRAVGPFRDEADAHNYGSSTFETHGEFDVVPLVYPSPDDDEPIEDDSDDDDTDDGPQDGDAVVYCDGNRYAAGFHNEQHIGTFVFLDDAYAALRQTAGHGWVPDYWFISDHGNAWRTDDHGRELK